jgi:uncharacterized cupredoxin-like copper-binding protein
MPRRLTYACAVLALVGAVFMAACSGDDDDADSGPAVSGTEAQGGGGNASTTVAITERDYAISADDNSVAAGKVTFKIENEGATTHEFVVFKTDLPEGQLPINADTSQVDEEASGVEVVDEKEDIAAGKDASLSVELEPGKYVFVCNLPGHYTLGMHGSLVATGGS